MIYGYARVSTLTQGREGNSLEDQVNALYGKFENKEKEMEKEKDEVKIEEKEKEKENEIIDDNKKKQMMINEELKKFLGKK